MASMFLIPASSKYLDIIEGLLEVITYSRNDNDTNDYSNKMFAQDNEPVSKDELSGTESNISQPTQNVAAQDNEPVSKSDIDGVKIDKDNKLTNSYNDMMQRMDNLYKDDENNDEEEEKS